MRIHGSYSILVVEHVHHIAIQRLGPKKKANGKANAYHPIIKCTDEVSEIETTFLGTSEYKGERFEKERILDGRTYLRPTERFQYTPFNSCHPGRGGGVL